MSGKKGARRANSVALDDWVPRYLAGETMTAIAHTVGVTPDAVRQALLRRGLHARPIADRAFRRYTCNESFFTVIDSEAKAYWLGFIAADGNVHRDTLSIGLAPVDNVHLHAFVVALSGTQQVTTRQKVDGFSVATLKLNSVAMVRSLAQYGVVPRKSLTFDWPAAVPDHLIRHFLRGYIDGDGSWHWKPSRVGRPTWTISLVGTDAFLCAAMAALVRSCDLRPVEIRPASKECRVMRFSYGGNRQVSRIAHWLYDDATVFLSRKYVRAMEAIAESARTISGWGNYPKGCADCGTLTERYFACGFCRLCYNRHRRASRHTDSHVSRAPASPPASPNRLLTPR